MRRPRKLGSGARRSSFAHQTRSVLLGLPAPGKHRPLRSRELKLWSATKSTMRRSSPFRQGETRMVIIGGDSPPRRKPMKAHEAALWAVAKRRSYLGLAIGVVVGLVLLVIAFLAQ